MQKQLHSEPKETIYEWEFQLKRRNKPFALQSESPIIDLNDSDIQNRSLNIEDIMLRTFFLATATNFPFALHSTMIKQKLN